MNFKKAKLKSGITLITVPMAGTLTATVLVVAKTGSAYEQKSINGISHFLEHMMFKGTARRPSTLAISEELDAVGGEYNAMTSKEWTGYYAKADYRQLPLLLDIIADIYQNSKFDQTELGREQMVILEEMNMYLDTPMKYVDDLAEELLYGNQPQGWKIIGEPQTVKAVNRAKMVRYFQNHYVGANTVVIVAGKFDQSKISRAVSQNFANIKSGQSGYKVQTKETQSLAKIKLYYKKTDQTHLVIAMRAYHVKHKSLPALKLLNIILGGNMSSRLFINIRERHGLCYYINSQVEAGADCGYLAVKAGVDNKRAGQAVELIIKELRQLRDQGITPAELKKAKDFLRGKLALNLETSSDLAFWVGGQEVSRQKIKTPEQVLAEIDQIDVKKIQTVARAVIQNQGLNLAMISPIKDQIKFKRILRI